MNRFVKAFNVLVGRSEPKDSVVNYGMFGASNMFGSIAKNLFPLNANGDFIPIDSEGGTMRLRNGHEPQWLGLESVQMQAFAYNYCSPLAAVIDRIAQADS